MPDYTCSPPATGVFTNSRPYSLNYMCNGVSTLYPLLHGNCPSFSGFATNVQFDYVQYNNLPLVLTHQAPDFELYETDFTTHTVQTNNIYANQPGDVNFGSVQTLDNLGYKIYPNYYSKFDFKVYTLICKNASFIRVSIYLRVTNVVANDGHNLLGDSLFTYVRNNLWTDKSSIVRTLSCASGIYHDCGPYISNINTCNCTILQSGVINYV